MPASTQSEISWLLAAPCFWWVPWNNFKICLPRQGAIMQNRVFTPFLLRFWKWTMKSESFSNAVLHFDQFYLKYRKLKRFEQWRTHAVCCRHLPTTTFRIFLECWRFLDQNEIFKKHCPNSLNTFINYRVTKPHDLYRN